VRQIGSAISSKELEGERKADLDIHQPSSGNISNNSSFAYTPAIFWVLIKKRGILLLDIQQPSSGYNPPSKQ
jgi:hypothetical protein